MATAERDQNFVPTLIAVSSVDLTTPIKLVADPTTGRLLVDLGGTATAVILTSPDNTQFQLLVANDGTLYTQSI